MTLTLLSGSFQLTVALGMDFYLSPCEHIVWRHIADGAVQPDIVVTVHILLDQAFPGRMHSLFRDLCQRSSFPFDCA